MADSAEPGRNTALSDPGRKRQTVLFVTPWLAGGGIARNIEVVAPWFARRGHPVQVLAWDIRDKLSNLPNPFLQSLRSCGIPVTRLQSYGRLRLLQRAFHATTIAYRYRAKTIVGHGLEGNIVASFVKLLMCGKIRLVLEIHLSPDLYILDHTSAALLIAAKRLFRIADRIITVSNTIREEVCKFYKLNPSKIATVYNPMPLEKIRTLSREDISAAPEGNFIVGCGRLVEAKGFGDLIDAFSRLRPSTLKLIILGEGPLRHELLHTAARLRVADRVFLPGFVPNPYAYFAKARAFVLSSYSEAFSLVLVEAMACKTPVISSRCKGGPEEILDNGKFGLLYPTRNIGALAHALTRILENPTEAAARSGLALERARDFSATELLPKWSSHILGE